MPDDALPVRVENASAGPLRLIVLQKPDAALPGPLVSHVWDARALAGGAVWRFGLPPGFKVGGWIDLGAVSGSDGFSTSNLEEAACGQRWAIVQEKGGALGLERRLPDLPDRKAVRVANEVEFARRRAVLWKGDQPVLGVDLDARGEADLALAASFTLAVSSSARPGEPVDPGALPRSIDIPLPDPESVSEVRITVHQDPTTGKVGFDLAFVPWKRKEKP